MPKEVLNASRAPAPTDETTAGNYFIANYPPFSFWKEDRVAEAHAALDRPPDPATPLGVYLHIPFCRKRCHFCYFRVYTDKDSKQIKGYLDAALRELELYAARSFVGGRKANFVYFGGGTPSYLSTDQLLYLTQGMQEQMPWDEAEEVTFECEPGTLTEHKLEVLRKLGVTRLSLGIENFDDRILEVNGRAHRSKEIVRSYACAQGLKFPQINIDLIAGMVGEHEENWRACVRQAIALEADSVTVYQMEIPYNTTVYRDMQAQGRQAAPVADWPTKRAWVRYAFEALERAGYTIGSAYTAVKDPARTRFLYRDRLWAGADLVGLGVASFSHVGGTHFQNQADFEPYVKQLQAGRLPLWRALTLSVEERFLREWILQFKLGRVRFSCFEKKFAFDPRARLDAPLRRLAAQGLVSLQGDEVRLSREGLLQVDRLLPEFFLPAHRGARYS